MGCILFDEIDFEFEKFLELIRSINQPIKDNQFVGLLKEDGTVKFGIYMNVLSHIAARNYDLNHVIRNGIRKLYAQIFTEAQEDEELVVECLRNTLTDECIIDASKLNAFPNRMMYEWWKYAFETCIHDDSCDHKKCTLDKKCLVLPLSKDNFCRHKRDCSRPIKYAIRVPYLRALEAMRSRAFVIEKEYIYMTYHDADLIMMCYWDYKVQLWKEYDQEHVFFSLLKANDEMIDVLAPRVTDEKVKKRMRYLRNMVIHPTHEFLKMNRYCAETDDLVYPVYQLAIACVAKQSVSPLRNNPFGPSSSSSSNYIQEIADYTPQGTDFYEHYFKMLPPCIFKMLRYHLDNHTHPQNDHRFMLFRFFNSVKIPIEAVENVWMDVINRATTARGKLHELRDLPRDLYKRSNAPGAKVYPFDGCETMAKVNNLCPFVDIEDIGARKRHCGSFGLWHTRLKQPTNTVSIWPKRGVGWSPVIAYNSLVNYHTQK